MKFELEVVYNNADNGDTDRQNVNFETADEKTEFLVAVLGGRVTNQTLEQLFKHLYDNPNMDGSEVGVAYEVIWKALSWWAFEKLGWNDVTVDVVGLTVDGQKYEINPDMIDYNDWSLQLSREGFMYCYA